MSELSARVKLASVEQPLPKMWIGILLGILFLVLELIEGVSSPNVEGPTGATVASLLTSFSIWFYWLYCVFKFHDAVGRIPGYQHPITPARAVALHFVPFYNFYWIFRWPTALARFVNWRMQAKKMRGWIAGLLVLAAVLTFRFLDGFLGAMLLFGCGWYICRQLRHAFAAPPVPESAMSPPSRTGILQL
ncbi:MAG: hypothetical protein LAP85_16750 [Acidobacteriia bacterium]|nr:hypothetical protein [Terriglobia bacterium]